MITQCTRHFIPSMSRIFEMANCFQMPTWCHKHYKLISGVFSNYCLWVASTLLRCTYIHIFQMYCFGLFRIVVEKGKNGAVLYGCKWIAMKISMTRTSSVIISLEFIAIFLAAFTRFPNAVAQTSVQKYWRFYRAFCYSFPAVETNAIFTHHRYFYCNLFPVLQAVYIEFTQNIYLLSKQVLYLVLYHWKAILFTQRYITLLFRTTLIIYHPFKVQCLADKKISVQQFAWIVFSCILISILPISHLYSRQPQ